MVAIHGRSTDNIGTTSLQHSIERVQNLTNRTPHVRNLLYLHDFGLNSASTFKKVYANFCQNQNKTKFGLMGRQIQLQNVLKYRFGPKYWTGLYLSLLIMIVTSSYTASRTVAK